MEEEEKYSTLLPPQKNGEGYTTADVLRDCGVFLLSPRRRAELAAGLDDNGVTPDDVLKMHSFLSESEPDQVKVRRYLAAALADPKEAKLAILAMKDYEAHRPALTVSYGTHQPGFPVPYWICECSACDGARAAGKPNAGQRPNYLLDGVVPDWAIRADS